MNAFTKRHNPQLEQRLNSFIKNKETVALCNYLKMLSNADFRTASYLLSEKLLTTITDETFFWRCFNSLSSDNSRAYLGTCLKAAKVLLHLGIIHISQQSLVHFAIIATPIDKHKILEGLLPHLNSLQEIRTLLDQFCEKKAEARIAYLLSGGTDLCYFLLFQHLRLLEDAPNKLRSYCIQLMKIGEKKSFNLAAMMQKYFGIGSVPGRFSLQIEHYQLSQLDRSFDTFQRILNS